jgi:hypothetical protein
MRMKSERCCGLDGLAELRSLREYWERRSKPEEAAGARWDTDNTLLSGLHLGVLETSRYLHEARGEFDDFADWILERNDGAIETDRLLRLRRALNGEQVGAEVDLAGVEGLSEEDLRHWDEHGYVVLRSAVSKEQARAAELAIYEFLGKDPNDPDSWYWGGQGHTIWVAMLRHPAFWANRRSPRMVKAFAQLWGREDLWVSIDQGGLNPPERAGWTFPGPHLHWDVTIAEPRYFGVQGILYLADTAANQGAFTCIPGFHRTLGAWLDSLPAGANPREEILKHPGAKPIAAAAGDMVIWHHLLPHGSSPNSASRPRVAQYITMRPTRWDYNDVWK